MERSQWQERILEPAFQHWFAGLDMPLGEAVLLAGYGPTDTEREALNALHHLIGRMTQADIGEIRSGLAQLRQEMAESQYWAHEPAYRLKSQPAKSSTSHPKGVTLP